MHLVMYYGSVGVCIQLKYIHYQLNNSDENNLKF
jgi:hypothetical protein